jgi:YHS domain-containing protein
MNRVILPAALVAGLLGLSLATAPAGAQKDKEAKCPVSGKALTVDEKTPKILVNGRPSYFCCPNCPKAFAKTPEKFVKDAGKCPVMEHPATPDASARKVVNNNLYYVCCPGCDVTAAPEKSLKTLTDPVNKKEFKVTAASPRSEHEGQVYFFSAPECKAAFDKEPAKYAVVFGK